MPKGKGTLKNYRKTHPETDYVENWLKEHTRDAPKEIKKNYKNSHWKVNKELHK